MNIKIIHIGKIKDKLILEKINYYNKILNSDNKICYIEIKDSNKEEETNKLKQILSKYDNSYVFVLSEEGKEHSSINFSKIIKKITLEYNNIIFCIGGPNGISKPINFGNEILSLSKMTFTHEMIQLFLIEQIYRAYQINKGTEYHKN